MSEELGLSSSPSGLGSPASLGAGPAEPVMPGRGLVENTFVIPDSICASETKEPLRGSAEQFTDAAMEFAERLRETTVRLENSPAAISRLAHAELAAGNVKEAVEAAVRSADVASRLAVQHGRASLDVGSVAASLQVLLFCGEQLRAERIVKELPAHPVLNQLLAKSALGRGDLIRAHELLVGIDTPTAQSMRGYLYLKQDNPQRALAELRSASRCSPNDSDVYMNMAVAYWRLGSAKKSIKLARQASKMSPENKIYLFALIGQMLAMGEYDNADAEVRAVRKRGVAESPEFLLVQAKIAFDQRKLERTFMLLNRAQELYRRDGNTDLVAQIRGNLALLRLIRKQISKESALVELRRAIREAPHNAPLIEMFADLAETKSMARELRRYIEALPGSTDENTLFSVRYRLAYLENRFADAAELAHQWANIDYLNLAAVVTEFMMRAQALGDWAGAADLASRALHSFKWSPVLANEAAYVLALAGRIELARRALAGVTEWNYVLKATAGLVEIAAGNVDRGLYLYREAATLADKSDDAQEGRSLMTLHQTLALQYLKVMDKISKPELLAKSLPPVALPEDWEEKPQFQILRWMANRHGWAWPMVIDSLAAVRVTSPN